MGCTCSKEDVLVATPASVDQRVLTTTKTLTTAVDVDDYILKATTAAKKATTATATLDCPESHPSAVHADFIHHTSSNTNQKTTTTTTTSTSRPSPSTPSTHNDDEDDDDDDDDDDDNDLITASSDHMESDEDSNFDELGAYKSLKGEVVEELQHISDLERSVKQDSFRLIEKLDHSDSSQTQQQQQPQQQQQQQQSPRHSPRNELHHHNHPENSISSRSSELGSLCALMGHVQQELQNAGDLQDIVRVESQCLINELDTTTSNSNNNNSQETRKEAPPLSHPKRVKLLLTGDDASYIMKLMRFTHQLQQEQPLMMNEQEQVQYRDLIRANVVQDMRVLCRHLRQAEFGSYLLFTEEEQESSPPPDIFDTLSSFWQLSGAWKDIKRSTTNADGTTNKSTATPAAAAKAAGGDTSSNDSEDDCSEAESVALLEDCGGGDDEGGAAVRENRISPRKAYDILVSVLLADEKEAVVEDDTENDDTEEGVEVELNPRDIFEDEKEATDDTKLFLHLWREIGTLWQSFALKEFLSERPWLLPDSVLVHSSLLEDLPRIASHVYSVTAEDMLVAVEDPSTRMEPRTYRVEGIDFEFSHQVGEDSLDDNEEEDCSETIESSSESPPRILVFACSLTGFDQTEGSYGGCKMARSIERFRSFCERETTHKTLTVAVVLTKKELFAEKLSYSDISTTADFVDFSGQPGNCDEALLYFVNQFMSCLGEKESCDDDIVHILGSSESAIDAILLDLARKIQVPCITTSTTRDDEPSSSSQLEHVQEIYA